ncbi:hypothetical protein HDU83_005030 [Entophlyctis luteolus]|nr:hypothetical protein HDU83_005030 [Entophlyctis luteolus]
MGRVWKSSHTLLPLILLLAHAPDESLAGFTLVATTVRASALDQARPCHELLQTQGGALAAPYAFSAAHAKLAKVYSADPDALATLSRAHSDCVSARWASFFDLSGTTRPLKVPEDLVRFAWDDGLAWDTGALVPALLSRAARRICSLACGGNSHQRQLTAARDSVLADIGRLYDAAIVRAAPAVLVAAAVLARLWAFFWMDDPDASGPPADPVETSTARTPRPRRTDRERSADRNKSPKDHVHENTTKSTTDRAQLRRLRVLEIFGMVAQVLIVKGILSLIDAEQMTVLDFSVIVIKILSIFESLAYFVVPVPEFLDYYSRTLRTQGWILGLAGVAMLMPFGQLLVKAFLSGIESGGVAVVAVVRLLLFGFIHFCLLND